MLIRAYGLLWNPDTVDWGAKGKGKKGTLKGRIQRKEKKYEVDFWEAQGIYVLHADFKAVYIGKAHKTPLGPRLRDHLTDRFAGRWDMFSWFSLSTAAVTEKRVRPPGTRKVKPIDMVNTLEALAILIGDPPLNRKRESLPSALQADQVKSPHPKTIRRYLEDILKKLEPAR